MEFPPLPITDALPELLAALKSNGRAVLQAPPGAGKTTLVPLAILQHRLTTGRIIMLEPRRLAARAAAERMAELIGEPLGKTVGYRVRGDAKVSEKTRIEVVTEGILTRRIQSDPGLSGVGAVIFDEFHERSLNADLGLALCLEIAGALRDDLTLLAMSATLDAEPVARLMDAPIITSEGRRFPVETRHLTKPLRKEQRFETAMADLIEKAAKETEGGILVFLPGEGEIRRVEALLRARLSNEFDLRPLFGAMDFAKQRAAIAPVEKGRKIVLATSIAETSLTIEDIRVVVDGGKARRARFDPSSGMSRLVTEPVSKAEAEQRRGRAGRVAEGVCYKLWTKGEDGALPAYPPTEIEVADLAGFALELAQWGSAPEDLAFLNQPNSGSFAEAQTLLRMLGALEADNRITKHGKDLAKLPLHPRLAHMLTLAGPKAGRLAALLGDHDPLPNSAPVDLSLRLKALANSKDLPYAVNQTTITRVKAEAKHLSKQIKSKPEQGLSDAACAALAYPDRIGKRRKGDAPRYILASGKGAIMPEGNPLSQSQLIVATGLDGNPREARIRQAVMLSETELRTHFTDQIIWKRTCTWDKRKARVLARKQECFAALILDERNWHDAPEDDLTNAMLQGIRELGLTWNETARRLVSRVEIARDAGQNLPDMSEPALLEALDDWLAPFISGVLSAQDWKRFDMLEALTARLGWDQMQMLDKTAPGSFITPLGRAIPIDYGGEGPEIKLRLQEMFGQTVHPTTAGKPLKVTLLSPAGRPVQTTMDIPGFWANSYTDVRKDMRGRYPKHPWPEDPTQADPTLRAKTRK
ncbi:MAG: ATP-dependent helicase HrpB [Pseudomonadota bacterium]